MRRVGVVLVLALAAGTGCAIRPDVVPGAAAPLTATDSTGPASTDSPTPSGSPLPPVPNDFRTLTMTGFGVTVTLPVPRDWAATPSKPDGLTRTDVDLQTPEVLLRIDLSARGPGSAADGAVRNEQDTTLADYRRLAITPVDGVGEDAADWTFTFVRNGTRQVVDRQIVDGDGGIAVYYSAPIELYKRYLPVWNQAVQGLTITIR
ncbi:MAG TPA: hypothetical protein VGP36_26170 [Mycobacteriales bacterium]|nr:hypothetical protein [Mycobacteriales bacterium]